MRKNGWRKRYRPWLEALEDRLTPSTLIPVTGRRDLVFDPGRDVLYITTASGQVQRWDVAGQQLLSPWNVGTALNGADITPDDSSLYVAEDQASNGQGFFHQVSLTNGSVTNVPYSTVGGEVGAWDVAIAANGKALVSTQYNGSGWVPLRQLDTTNNSYVTRTDAPGSAGGGQVRQDTLISRSADRGLFLLTESNITSGPFFLYNALTDTFSSSQSSGLFLDNSSPAVNRNGTLLAIETDGTLLGSDTPGVAVFDPGFRSVQNLPGLTGGVVFDPTQDVLYGVNPTTDRILAYDTTTWALKYSLPVGEAIGDSSAFGTGVMAVSPDDKYLFLSTASGVREYALPRATGVAASLSVTGFPAFIPLGTPGLLTVTALDPAGNVAAGYRGTVHFASTLPGSLPADYTFTAADNGSHTFAGVSLNAVGTQSITATDQANGLSGSEAGIAVHFPGTNYIPVSGAQDLVYDPTRGLLYVTATDGTVQRYDPAAQTLLAPFQVGASLNGADITPDGVHLYVADNERGAAQGWFHDLNLVTGAVTNLAYPLSNGAASWDVTVGPNGKALADARVEGSGWVALQQIDTSTDTLSVRTDDPGSGFGGTVRQDSVIARSADRSLFVVAESNISNGPLFSYAPASNTFPHSTHTNGFNRPPAVNRNGTLIAADVASSVVIYDPSFNVVTTLSGVSGGLCFDPTRDVLYVADTGSDNLIAYDTTTWAAIFKAPLGENFGLGGFGPGTMTVSADGKLLFLVTPTEVRVFNLPVAGSFSVSGLSSPFTAGGSGNITVKALAPDGTVLTGYRGTVHFTSSDLQAGLPVDYTFTPADNGSHTFTAGVTLKTAGPQSVTVTDTAAGVLGSQSGVVVTPAAADHLAFGAQPGNTLAGTALSPAVTVRVLDQFGNLKTNDNTDQVTLSVASGPGGFAAGSTTTVTASGGVASFDNLVLNTAGTYTLVGTATGGITGPASNSFLVAALSNHLAFGVQPGNITAGSAISPAVTVRVLDGFGNLITGDNGDQVTLTVASGPGGFTAGSTTTLTVSGGVATFSNLVLNTAGTYTLAETATGGLTGPNSGSFTVSPAAADHLAFGVQPGNTVAGTVLSPAVTVQVFDKYGNLATNDNTDQVTLSVASGPGGFAAGSTTTVTVSGGVAAFSNLVLNTAGAYTLGVSGTGGITGPASAGFTVSPATADHLGFGVQPTTTVAGVAVSPAVTVQVFDRFGNLVTSDNSERVTVTKASGPGGFTAGSTTTVTVSGGVATFGNLVLNTAGAYTLGESGTGGITGPASSSFTVVAAVPDHLGFGVQPGTAVAGTVISPAVTARVLDKYGNLETSDNTDQVSVAVASGPGGFAAGSTTTATVSGGIASFSNLVLDTAGSYTLGESATGGLTGPASSSFTVVPAAPDHLGFGVQPTTTVAGTAVSPAVTVRVFDKYGNFASNDNSGQVTLSVATGPGSFAAGSTTTVTVSAGVATFGNLILDTAGAYTLGASGTGGLTGPASSSFTVSAAAANHLGFGVQPGTTVAGAAIGPAVTVQVLDKYGNPLTNDNSGQVTVSVASGPGGLAAGSTTTAAVSAGVASFNNLILDIAGSYTLGETATGGLAGPASNSFTVSPAAGNRLAFQQQPSTAAAGVAISPAVTVQVSDRFGNLATNDNTDQVTLSVATGPGTFTAGSTTTVTVSGGVASFNNLAMTTVGSYTLGETATGGLTGTSSASFAVSAGAPDHLGFGVQPNTTVAGVVLIPAVKVQVFDQFGNRVSTDNTGQVTLSVASGPGGFAVGSITTAPVIGGVATFGNLLFDTAGSYTLGESATGGLTGPASASFTVLPAAADHLGFGVQPGTTMAGTAINPAVAVQVLDKYGNLLTNDNTDQVTVALAGGPGVFTSDSVTRATVGGGVATFGDLVLDTAGPYALKAVSTSGLLFAPNSAGFTVVAAAPDHLAVIAQPSGGVTGDTLSPPVQVQVLDRFGNVATQDNTDQVTLSVASGPGTFTAGSTTTVTVSGGMATFGNVGLTIAGSYTLGASATGGLTGPASTSFLVNIFDDDFNRPNNPTLGSGWTQVVGSMGVQANQLLVGGSGAALAFFHSAPLANPGVGATISLTGTQYAGLVARYAGPGAANFYLGEVVGGGGKFTAYLLRNQGGTYTLLASAPVSGGAGALRLEVVGSSLKLFFNSQLVTYAYDSALTTGATGVWGSPGARLDDFGGTPISPVSVTLPFTDPFAQADGSQLNRSWTERVGNFVIRGQRLGANGSGANLATLNQPATAPGDTAVQADVSLSAAGTQYAGVVTRYQGPGAGNYYLGEVVGTNSIFSAYLFKNVNGAFTQLGTAVPVGGGTGTLRLEAVGGSLKLFFNNQLTVYANDTAFTTGAAGVYAGGGASLDNFSAAPLTTTPVTSLPFSDNFGGAAGTQLSRSWTGQAGNFAAQGGGQLRANGPGLNLATVNLSGAALVADVAVQATIQLSTAGTQYAGLVGRYSGSGDGNEYVAEVVGVNGVFTAYIYRHVGSTWTQLSARPVSGGSGLLLFTIKGSHLTLSLNGTVVGDVTDGAITAPGLVGLRAGGGALYSGFSVAAA